VNGDAPPRSPLESARAALAVAERFGDLDADGRLDLIARGIEVGRLQRAYLNHASTCALLSIAESLEQIAAR